MIHELKVPRTTFSLDICQWQLKCYVQTKSIKKCIWIRSLALLPLNTYRSKMQSKMHITQIYNLYTLGTKVENPPVSKPCTRSKLYSLDGTEIADIKADREKYTKSYAAVKTCCHYFENNKQKIVIVFLFFYICVFVFVERFQGMKYSALLIWAII